MHCTDIVILLLLWFVLFRNVILYGNALYLSLMPCLVSHATHHGLMSHNFLKVFSVSCKGPVVKEQLEKTLPTLVLEEFGLEDTKKPYREL